MVWVDPAVDLLAYGSRRVALTSGGQVRVKEGDAVQKGELIAQLDTAELRAQHAGAKAAVQRAIAAIARAEADIAIRKAEYDLAELETQRVAHLEQTSAGTKADLDRRRAQSLVTAAQIEGSRAALVEANAAKEAADAQVTQIEAMLDDSELHTPVSGRVEYKLVQAGEVVAAGGRLVTILDLSDVYMTIFLPTRPRRARLAGAHRTRHGSGRGFPRDRLLRRRRSAVHAEDGRDAERAAKADVPCQARHRC